MKKMITLVLVAIIILTSFTGCFLSEDETAFEEEMSTELNTIYEDLQNNIPDPSDVEAQKEYLLNWAGTKNIPVSYDKNNNVIMSKKATEGYEEAKQTIIQCPLGTGEPAQQYEAMATALYLISQSQKHGFIRLLFTPTSDNEFIGAETISTNYLKGDYFINLTWDEKTAFTIGSAGTSEYHFSKELHWIEPTYPRAYEISIQSLNGGSSGITTGSHPNPIKLIGDFLASAKSSGILIELASFNGGEKADNYPSAATAVVLINDNDVKRFEKRFSTAASKFEDKYADIEENYTYTMTPVEAPAHVISKDDSTNVFTLLYTMINGIYLKSDEGDITATSNIGVISTTSGNLDLNICARSLYPETMEEMSSTFSIICGLNDISYELVKESPIWKENQESTLLLHLTDLFAKDFDKKIKYKTSMNRTECSVFKNRNENIDILSMSVNFENGITEVEALYHFLEALNVPWAPESAAEQK